MQSVKSLIFRNDFVYIKDMFIYFLSLCLFVVIFRLTHARRKIKSRNPLAESAKKEYYMLHKPAGVISATKDDRDKTVLDLITD